MSPSLTASQVLDREFLDVRARLLEIGAALDRIERAEGSAEGDARLARIRQGLSVLAGRQPDRAEQIQLLFSRPYEADWRKNLAPGAR
jgi:hypothetical protein